MDVQHLTPETADRLLTGSLTHDERRNVVRHLLEGCTACGTLVLDTLERQERAEREVSPASYRRPVAKALEAIEESERLAHEMALERIAAPGLVALLTENETIERQRMRIATDARFQTWGLAERLIEESTASTWSTHPDQTLTLALAAVAVTRHLSVERYGQHRVHDLAAQAYGCLANAHRIRAEFDQARDCFEVAHDHLEEGLGDPLTEAKLISLRASLLTDQGYFEAAAGLLDEAAQLYRALGERHLEARMLVKKAIALGNGGAVREAVDLLSVAEGRIDLRREPRLFLCARHNRIWFLNELGASEQALMLLDASRSVYDEFPDSWVRLRRRWVEARIARGLGHTDEAEAVLSRLWTTAFTRGLELDVALISLDLSAIYVEQGKFAHAWQLASRLLPLFQSWGVHRRALEAWALLRQTFGAQTASVELVQRIAAYVTRGWRNPEIPFQ